MMILYILSLSICVEKELIHFILLSWQRLASCRNIAVNQTNFHFSSSFDTFVY